MGLVEESRGDRTPESSYNGSAAKDWPSATHSLRTEKSWDQALASLSLHIHRFLTQALTLEEILQATVDEVRCILECDRTLIYRFEPDWSGSVMMESVSEARWSLLDRVVHDACFESRWIGSYQAGYAFAFANLETANLTPCHTEFLRSFQIKANLVVPVLEGDRLWGLLIAHHCTGPRQWSASETEGLQQLVVQVSIAIQQASLFEQLQQSQAELEENYRNASSQLHQSQQQQAQLAAIVESSQDAILSKTCDGIITSWNRAAEQLFGYSAAEAIGAHISFLVPSHLQAEEQHLLEAIGQGHAVAPFETQRQCKDGHLINVSVTLSLLRDETGQVIGASNISKDIGDRKKLEAALQEQASILQIFYEQSPLMMGVVEITDQDIFHVSQNPATSTFFQVSPAELTGHWASELGIPSDHIQMWLTHYRHSQQRQDSVQFAYEHTIDSTTHWLSATVVYLGIGISGRPRFSYIVQDESERKWLEAERQRAHAIEQQAQQVSYELNLLESILDVILAGYWDWDIPGDREYLSPGFKRMFGYGDDELPNCPDTWKQLIFPEDLPSVFECFDRHVQSHGEVPYYNEVRYRHKDGSTVWVICSGQVIEWDAAGNPLRMIGCHIDITRLKQSEKTLRKSEATKLALINAVPDFLVRMRRDGVQMEEINEGAVCCLHPGDSTTAVNGTSVTEIMPRAIAQERIQLAELALYTSQTQRQEYEFVQQGQTYYEEARISPLWDDDVLVVVRDITPQKQTELHLKTAKEQLELFIQATFEGFWDWNLVTGDIYFSPRWKEMLGYAEDELENSLDMWQSVILEEDYAAAIQLVDDYNSGKVDQFATTQRFRHKNGSIVHILARAIHLTDVQGKAMRMVGSHLDMTPMVEMQAALKDSEMRLSSILDSSLDGVMAFRSVRDENGNIIDFEWILSNPTACETVGHRADDLIHKRLLQELPGNRDEGLFDLYVQVVESGEPIQRQFYYNHDGIDCWFENIAVKLGDGFVVTFRNITAIKQSEQALQNANQQLEAHLDDLKQRNDEMVLLSETSDFLQACLTIEEACTVMTTLVEPLFPGCAGGIFITGSSRNRVEAIASWGTCLHSATDFHPNACWGLRRGRLHWAGHHRPGLCCNHVDHHNSLADTLCIPMIAQGETLGMFYLCSETAGMLHSNKRQLACTVAEQVALAIANLRLRETLQHQSIRDPLTGLFNRRYLEETLTQEIVRAQRHQHPIGVVMIDVDHFKRFNDTFGHDAGDQVLQTIGKLLREKVRGSDIACRYGGEELTLVMPESTLAETQVRAEDLREAISQLRIHRGGMLLDNLTASFGVACFPQHGTTGSELMLAADAALYHAKSAGRNQVVIVTQGAD